jgi:prepilin-type N-terminal cleavage/methylation domain-containing protein
MSTDCRLRLRARHAFSLVELSVVIVIISIIAVMGLEGTAIYFDRTAYNVTKERMAVIDKAILNFVRVNGRLPCPSYYTLTSADTCFGKEYNGATPTTCASSTSTCTSASFTVTAVVFHRGDVPVRDLGLPTSYMFDGYGTRIRYVVTATMDSTYTTFNTTTAGGLTIRSGKLDTNCGSAGNLCQTLATDAAYLLLSHGRDRRGAVSAAGASIASCSSGSADYNKIDAANCRFGTATTLRRYSDNTVVSIPYNHFYDSRYNSGNVAGSFFDDIIIWHRKSDLL